ncbi:MAG: hypothetical protein ACR2PG_19100 [Hyphomicrobiaceae bacterium]
MSMVLFAFVASAILGAEAADGPTLRMKVPNAPVVPGQAVRLTFDILVPTWMPSAPIYPNFEVANVMVRQPPRSSGPISESIGGETWSGVSQSYQLHPMVPGKFRIPPGKIVVTWADPETRKPRKTILDTQGFTVEGIAPDAAKDLEPFIAANTLSLKQDVEGKPIEMALGDSLTRKVVARISGVSPIVIPPLINKPKRSGLAVYAKEPLVSESANRDGITGQRQEEVTYVATTGGRYHVEDIQIRWYNLKTRVVETTTVDGFEIVVKGQLPSQPAAVDRTRVLLWAGSFVVVLIGAYLFGGRLWRGLQYGYYHLAKRYVSSEHFAYRSAMAALGRRDFSAVVHWLQIWDSRLSPTKGRADQLLSEATGRISAMTYGGAATSPTKNNDLYTDAAQALRMARTERRAAITARRAPEPLPPLNPSEL